MIRKSWIHVEYVMGVDNEPLEEKDEPLVWDLNVTNACPVIKGTWITVNHIVGLIVDGWSWSDILRTHPEITIDDIRACLAYTVENE